MEYSVPVATHETDYFFGKNKRKKVQRRHSVYLPEDHRHHLDSSFIVEKNYVNPWFDLPLLT